MTTSHSTSAEPCFTLFCSAAPSGAGTSAGALSDGGICRLIALGCNVCNFLMSVLKAFRAAVNESYGIRLINAKRAFSTEVRQYRADRLLDRMQLLRRSPILHKIRTLASASYHGSTNDGQISPTEVGLNPMRHNSTYRNPKRHVPVRIRSMYCSTDVSMNYDHATTQKFLSDYALGSTSIGRRFMPKAVHLFEAYLIRA